MKLTIRNILETPENYQAFLLRLDTAFGVKSPKYKDFRFICEGGKYNPIRALIPLIDNFALYSGLFDYTKQEIAQLTQLLPKIDAEEFVAKLGLKVNIGPKDYATLHQEIIDYLNSQPSISKVSELFENPNKYGDIVSHFSFKYNVVPGSGIVPGMTFNIGWKPTTVSTIFIPDYGYNPIYPENDIIEQVKVYLSDANPELNLD